MNKATLGLIVSCAAAAVVGYVIAKSPMDVAISNFPNFNTPAKPRQGEGSAILSSRRRTRVKDPRSIKQVTDLRKDLLQRFKDNPATAEDWTFRASIQAILAGLTEEGLQELMKEDLMVYLPGKGRAWDPAKLQLLDLVIAQWVSINPEGACRSLLGKDSYAMALAIGGWQKRDPDAARAWLNQAEFSESAAGFKSYIMRVALVNQVTTDFSGAKKVLASLDDEAQQMVLHSWSVPLARDPARRQELLALLASRGDEELTAKCYDSIVKEMARQSPAEAAAFVEASDLREDRKDELSHALLGEWALKRPQEAFTAWAELKEDSAPEQLLKAIDSWSMNSPGTENAIEWTKGLDAGPAREQFKMRLLDRFRMRSRFAQSADLSTSLEDPAERMRRLKILKPLWEEAQPDQANAFFAKLPPDDQQKLGMGTAAP